MQLIGLCVNLVIISLSVRLEGKLLMEKCQTVSGLCKHWKESFIYRSCHIEKDFIFNKLIYSHSLFFFFYTFSLSDSLVLVKSCCALRGFCIGLCSGCF